MAESPGRARGRDGGGGYRVTPVAAWAQAQGEDSLDAFEITQRSRACVPSAV